MSLSDRLTSPGLELTRLTLDAILEESLDGYWKGIPGNSVPVKIRDIPGRGWNVLREELPLPLLVLRQSALSHNLAWMSQFAAATGTRLCPHGKTTMSPQLFDLQLAAGAWGITAATVSHVQTYRRFGVERILLANQLLGAASIRYILDELSRDPKFDFYCLVDSPQAVELLRQAVSSRQLSRPLQVLLETGEMGGRCGARAMEARLATAAAVKGAAPHLVLRGVEAYEGAFQSTVEQTNSSEIDRVMTSVVQTAALLAQRGAFGPGPILLSAGGSAFFDIAARVLAGVDLGREHLVILRSGCYLVHDSDWCDSFFQRLRVRTETAAAIGDGLRPALELWAYVQSIPESRRAVVTFGKRDSGQDAGFPVALKWFRPGEHTSVQPLPCRATVTKMNDQHAYLELSDDDAAMKVGMLALGISHPCTTLDKWRWFAVVDDDYNVVDAIRTFF
jgi:D-serine dehydratase